MKRNIFSRKSQSFRCLQTRQLFKKLLGRIRPLHVSIEYKIQDQLLSLAIFVKKFLKIFKLPRLNFWIQHKLTKLQHLKIFESSNLCLE